MRNIWQPLFESWRVSLVEWLGVLGLVIYICAAFAHWAVVGSFALILFIGGCYAVVEMQVGILKDHIGKLEERVDDLERKNECNR